MPKKKEIKFTEDELKSVGDLQVKYNTVTNKFGQLAIAKLNFEKQQELIIITGLSLKAKRLPLSSRAAQL